MVSKSVTRRFAAAAKIASATTVWSAPTQQIVASLLEPYLRDGENMPDIGLFQELLGRLVADQGKLLVRGDQRLDGHVSSARLLRQRRDQEAGRLRELLRSARFYLDRLCGRGAGAKHGLGHGLSKMVPFHLARLGRQIADLLRVEELQQGAALGGMPDPADLSRRIAEQASQLRLVLEQLEPEVIGARFARGQQQQGLGATEKNVRRSAGLLAEIYKFCNHQLLAKRVRPVFRRRKGGQEPSRDPAAGLPAEPGLLADLDLSRIEPVVHRDRPAAPSSSANEGRSLRVRRRLGIKKPFEPL